MEDLLKKKIYVFAKLSEKALSNKKSPLKIKIEEILLNLDGSEYNIYIPDDIVCNFNNKTLENYIEEGLKKLSDSLPSSNKFRNLKNILNKNINTQKLKISTQLLQKRESNTNLQEVLIMGGLVEGHATNIVTKMIIEQNGTIRFEHNTPMLQARSFHDAVYYQDKVFSIGSLNGNAKKTLEKLDILTKKQFETELSNAIEDACVAVYKEKIYVISASCKVYKIKENNNKVQMIWQNNDLPNIKINSVIIGARTNAAAIDLNGILYLCGGVNKKSVWSFDGKKWKLEGEEMIKKRKHFSLYVFDDEIYAIGGDEYYQQNTTIEKRTKTGQWELVTNCDLNRHVCSTVLINSKIFLFGGFGDESTFDFFDLQTNKWASQDQDCVYFDINKRQLPRPIYGSKAVLITL
jgi:hypothetical protein